MYTSKTSETRVMTYIRGKSGQTEAPGTIKNSGSLIFHLEKTHDWKGGGVIHSY